MSRNKMTKLNSKSVNIKKISHSRELAKNREKVIVFLERDDNSRNIPGKADFVKSKAGMKIPKRVLTDYLSMLYRTLSVKTQVSNCRSHLSADF